MAKLVDPFAQLLTWSRRTARAVGAALSGRQEHSWTADHMAVARSLGVLPVDPPGPTVRQRDGEDQPFMADSIMIGVLDASSRPHGIERR